MNVRKRLEVEQMARELFNHINNSKGWDDISYRGFAKAFYELGYVKNGWISVKDRLPDESKSYIVCTSNGAVCTARFYNKLPTGLQYEKPHWSGKVAPYITHWQPLPEPPKEDNQ